MKPSCRACGLPTDQGALQCGGERPACTNCTKTDRICAGYQKSHAFILSKYVETSKPGDRTLRLANGHDPSPVLVSHWRPCGSGKPSSQGSKHPVIQLRAAISTPRLNVAVHPRNSLRDQLLSFFLNDESPLETVGRVRPGEYRSWLFELPRISNLTPALENAMLAVCTARLGRRGGNLALVHEALSLYTKGLRELQRAIVNPILCKDKQNIAACMALIMYEFAECPGRAVEGYLNHYHGAMRMLQLRGADAHVDGLAHSIFQTLRMHSAFNGLRQRRPTFLLQPEWMERPWTSIAKGHHDLLLDIFLQIPDVFAKSDRLANLSNPQSVFVGGLGVMKQCLHLDQELTLWHSRYGADISGPLYRPELSDLPSATDSVDLGKLFPVSFHFTSYVVGETMLLYWTAQVLLHTQLCVMSSRLSSLAAEIAEYGAVAPALLGREPTGETQGVVIGSSASSLIQLIPALEHRDKWPQTSARYICQSVEYFFQETLRSIGPGTLLPPLEAVRACLHFTPEDHTREVAWINEIISHIQRLGSELAGHI